MLDFKKSNATAYVRTLSVMGLILRVSDSQVTQTDRLMRKSCEMAVQCRGSYNPVSESFFLPIFVLAFRVRVTPILIRFVLMASTVVVLVFLSG